MITSSLQERALRAHERGKRLVAPMMGFPGVELVGSNIKLAQQNFGEHFRAVKCLADRFGPDLIFPLMDLSVEANALGRTTVFPKDNSAAVVRDPFRFEEMDGLKEINIAFDGRILGYVETMKMMSVGLPKTMLKGAYLIGPYTLAALILGADDAAVASIENPERLHELCDFAAETIQEYGRLLISAGADVIAVLEPSAVMLGPRQFGEFSAAYVKDISAGFKYSDVAVIYHICGNTMHLLGRMAESGAVGLSLDAPETGVELAEVARRVPEDILLLGNISPTSVMLHGTPADVEKAVAMLLKDMNGVPNFVLSTGCDLPQETPPENIEAFMRTGRSPGGR